MSIYRWAKLDDQSGPDRSIELTGGWGIVYKVDPAGHETVLYSFTGGADGGYPEAGVILDSAGNLYGTTVNGGIAGLGVVYKVDTAGHETVLHSFTGGADGALPGGCRWGQMGGFSIKMVPGNQ